MSPDIWNTIAPPNKRLFGHPYRGISLYLYLKKKSKLCLISWHVVNTVFRFSTKVKIGWEQYTCVRWKLTSQTRVCVYDWWIGRINHCRWNRWRVLFTNMVNGIDYIPYDWSILLTASVGSLEKGRARPGFEPGTSRTLSENHTPRPTSQRFRSG